MAGQSHNQEQLAEQLSLQVTPKLPENKNSGSVFGETGMSLDQLTLAYATNDARSNLPGLRDLKTGKPYEGNEQMVVDLERHRGRAARFAFLKKNATPEQSKILEKKESVESMRVSDFLFLKQQGADLANLLLVPTGVDPTKSTSNAYIESGEHKNFIVNFGDSKDFVRKNSLGAGDILPPTVEKITINGKVGIRQDYPTPDFPNVKRPGYYNIETKIYMPIYDGDKIEVLDIRKLSREESEKIQTATDERFRKSRIDDMIRSMDTKGDKWQEDFTLLPEDEALVKEAEAEHKNRAERKKRYERLFGMGMTESMFRQYFGDTINKYANDHNIPPELVVTLIRRESRFDFNAVNPDTGAFGFGQHVPKWQSWEEGEKALGRDLDKEDPFDQVIATIGYLVATKNQLERKQGWTADWADTVVAYHTGVSFDETRLDASMAVNKGIANLMRERTVAEYKRAARVFYEVDAFVGQWYAEMLAWKDAIHHLAWDSFVGMPAEKSENDITLCSRTAQKNARLFGVSLPRGDALNARSGYSSERLLTSISEAPADSNLLDVFMRSGSTYGHRSIAIKNKIDQQWYILDPYISSEKPVLLSDYPSKDKIVNVVAHQATKVFAPELLAQS